MNGITNNIHGRLRKTSSPASINTCTPWATWPLRQSSPAPAEGKYIVAIKQTGKRLSPYPRSALILAQVE